MNRDFYEDDVPEEEEKNNKEEEDEYNDNEFDDYNEKEENNEEHDVKKDDEEEYNENEFEDYNEESKKDESNKEVHKEEEKNKKILDIKEEKKEQDVQANTINTNKTITHTIPPQPNPIIQSYSNFSTYNNVNEIMKNKKNQNTAKLMSKPSYVYYNEKYDTYKINKRSLAVTKQQSKHINPLYFPHRTTKDSKLNKLLKNYYSDYRKLMKNNSLYQKKTTKKDEVDYYPTISPIDFKNKKKKIANMLCQWNEDYDFTLLFPNDDFDIQYSNESSLYDNNIDNVLVRNDFARRITRMTEEPYIEDMNNDLYQIKENESKYEDEYQSLDKKEHNKTASLPKEINNTIHTREEQKEDDSKENTIEENETPTITSNKTKTTIQNTRKSNDGYSKTIVDKEDNDDEAMKLYEQFERKTLSHYLHSNKHIIC